MTMPGMIVGVRHDGSGADGCKCGCWAVVGHAGHIVQDSDTAKLAALKPPMAIYAFDVPSLVGGASREHQVAYEHSDLGA